MTKVQSPRNKFVLGCEIFVPALASLLCLALPGSCLTRITYFLRGPCRYGEDT